MAPEDQPGAQDQFDCYEEHTSSRREVERERSKSQGSSTSHGQRGAEPPKTADGWDHPAESRTGRIQGHPRVRMDAGVCRID